MLVLRLNFYLHNGSLSCCPRKFGEYFKSSPLRIDPVSSRPSPWSPGLEREGGREMVEFSRRCRVFPWGAWRRRGSTWWCWRRCRAGRSTRSRSACARAASAARRAHAPFSFAREVIGALTYLEKKFSGKKIFRKKNWRPNNYAKRVVK